MLHSFTCDFCKSDIVVRHAASEVVACLHCNLAYRFDSGVKKSFSVTKVKSDLSPIQVGTKGVYKEKKFEIIGRLQYQLNSGLENEWYMYYDDGTVSWLSEYDGTFAVMFKTEYDSRLSKKIALGKTMVAIDTQYLVCDIKRSINIRVEGEVQWYDEKDKISFSELMNDDGKLYTVEYNKDGIYEAYAGAIVSLEDLKLTQTSAVYNEWK